jgi:hypothetical protein
VEHYTILHEDFLLVASQMMEEGIFFSSYSLNLTPIFLAREDVEIHLLLLKPRLESPG